MLLTSDTNGILRPCFEGTPGATSDGAKESGGLSIACFFFWQSTSSGKQLRANQASGALKGRDDVSDVVCCPRDSMASRFCCFSCCGGVDPRAADSRGDFLDFPFCAGEPHGLKSSKAIAAFRIEGKWTSTVATYGTARKREIHRVLCGFPELKIKPALLATQSAPAVTPDPFPKKSGAAEKHVSLHSSNSSVSDGRRGPQRPEVKAGRNAEDLVLTGASR
jgi:hypothetical protein